MHLSTSKFYPLTPFLFLHGHLRNPVKQQQRLVFLFLLQTYLDEDWGEKKCFSSLLSNQGLLLLLRENKVSFDINKGAYDLIPSKFDGKLVKGSEFLLVLDASF